MPGAAELLAEIEAAGIPFALVTSSEREIMDGHPGGDRRAVPGHCLRGRRDQEASPTPSRTCGPPRCSARNPARCVALEDSPNGVAAAQAAGCAVIAVPSVPPPPGLARLTVPSLRVLDLATLHEVVAGQGRAPMTARS